MKKKKEKAFPLTKITNSLLPLDDALRQPASFFGFVFCF